MGWVTTETPAPTKATVQPKTVLAQLVWKTTALLQKSPPLARERAAPLASKAPVHQREALAPTTAAKPPLQLTPVLAQQERLRKRLLGEVPPFFPQSCERSGECTEHNRGAWRRD